VTEYEQVDFDILLAESDYLSLHCPLSDITRNLIDAKALSKMKKSAILINVARGPVVNNRDLYEALENGTIAGAGLDVIEKEPITADNPLSKIMDSGKLYITPHLAWASVEARTRCVDGVRLNIEAFQRGEARNVVNL
jgi:glycerate dehydrogenase